MMNAFRSAIPVLCICGAAAAETVVLKDGSFFEGTITVETSRSVRLDTRFGERSFLRSDIAEIVHGGEPVDLDADFDSLPEDAREIRNAQIEYKLGHYDQALARLEKLGDLDDDPALGRQRDWLIIELHERMGRWDTARRLLREKAERGTPPERVRAQAHLDILEGNPDYGLQFVGEAHARTFLRDARLRNEARESNSLRNHDVLRAALEEYCDQLLASDKLSVKAFADKLDVAATYEAIVNARGRANLYDLLPYKDDLLRSEATLIRAQAVLGDYGKPYELDLARIELNHLLQVAVRLAQEAIANSPMNFTPPADPRSGRLTAEGRRQWVERCDEFLNRARPLAKLLEYMDDRIERFPGDLQDLREFVDNVSEQLDEMIKSVRKARGRTHV